MRLTALISTAALALSLSQTGLAQSEIPPGDWPRYTRDQHGMKYSPLEQINTENVDQMKPAWTFRFRTDEERKGGGGGFGLTVVTPIVVDGVMYLSATKRVVALDPATGLTLWEHVHDGRGNPSTRGVTYWPGNAQNPPRIIYIAGTEMVGLNANTGAIDPGFGNEGVVDIVVPYNSPPTVFDDKLFVGANVGEQQGRNNQPGNTRAYSADTGEKLWEFQSVPQDGQPGSETWITPGSNVDRTGVNNWGPFMAVDEERGILYTTYGSPASDYYGGDREGDNLFGNSVVALDADSGEMLWYFQTVHHDQWDFDLPPSPVLLDVKVNGEMVPMLAQTGKIGYMYILNRVTGEPVFGIDEVPVPQSPVPGEHSSPTQPIPRLPQQLARHQFDPATEMVRADDTTPEHAAACEALARESGGLVNMGPFTPWQYRPEGGTSPSSVVFPGAIGGTNWGGMAADPDLEYIFVNTNDYASIGWVQEGTDRAGQPVMQQRSALGSPVASKFWDRKTDADGRLMGASSWPCQRPPWGNLQAVNARTGEVAWKVVFGVTDELPEGKRDTGRLNGGGPIATAGGLLFIGATNDRRFRAYNSRTGEVLWETKLEYSAIATPITYMVGGRQYVAITASGGLGITDPNPSNNEQLYVFALPE